MNSDIRLRSRNTGRLAAAVISVALLALVLSVGISLLPFTAHASTSHDDFSGDNSGNHTGNGNNGTHGGDDQHDNDHDNGAKKENTYALCHNHLDDDSDGLIDLKDPGCADVRDDIPDLENGSITTAKDTASSTTLVVTDHDGDLIYFKITLQPQHGTLSGLTEGAAYALDALPTVTYTPAAGYVGSDTFEIKANDGLADEHDIVGQLATFDVEVVAPATPVCGDDQTLNSDTNTCEDNAPATPTCDDTQYLNSDNVCVANPVCGDTQTLDSDTHECVDNAPQGGNGGSNDPAPSTDAGSGNNGGGGGAVASGPLSIGFVNTNPTTGGEVLGTSTEATTGSAPSCSPYLTTYLKKGSSGDEVKKLQSFLNQNLGLSLPVTGYFGPLTFAAVSSFQSKYADEILKPWFDQGFSKDMNPSGYAYKMTLFEINLLQCATLDTPAPQLP